MDLPERQHAQGVLGTDDPSEPSCPRPAGPPLMAPCGLGGLLGILNTLLATAELTSPLGVKNCTGSCLCQLVVSTVPESPSEFQLFLSLLQGP